MERVSSNVQSVDSGESNGRSVITNHISNFLKPNINSIVHSVIILMVVCVSLYNLSVRQGDNQFWRDVLMFSFGLVIPTPSSAVRAEKLRPTYG